MKEQNNAPTPRVVRGTKPSKRQKKNLSKGQRIARTILSSVGKVLLTTTLVLIITGCIVGTALTIYVMQFIDTQDPIDLKNLDLSYTTIIYGKDAEGNDKEVQRLHRAENRIWVDLKDIPDYMQAAVVYSEDERFYDHDGIDFRRTVGAVLNELQRALKIGGGDRYGASTITQQLIKNINGDIDGKDRTIDNKINEIMQAMSLERHYTKDQILEAYLNYIGLGYNTNGVQAGALLYFGKDVGDLSIAEAASLAVISKNPSNYNPIKYPESNRARRDYALGKMLEFGAITQAEYDEAIAQPVVTASEKDKENTESKSTVYNSFIDGVIEEIIADLMEEYGYNYDYAEQLITTGGYRLYTTMDINAQNKLDSYFSNEENFAIKGLKEEKIPQAAMVIMDLNGNVVAMVGQKGEKEGSRNFNRATMAKRPFGSTIKPLSIYAPAFENGLITWSSMMEDAPKMNKENKKDGELNWPQNYNKRYDGNMLIIDALKVSKNTIPVELCNYLTPEYSYSFLTKQLHFHDLRGPEIKPYNDAVPASMALGDGGTTLVDLTAAFQIFGNGGYFTDHKMYTKVLDAEGKVILDVSTRSKNQVISSQTAYIMNRGLWQVVNGDATPVGSPSGTGASVITKSGWETVGKTGTSNDRKDLLFVGVTPKYVAGIRYGFDDNKEEIPNAIGSTHIKVWANVMKQVLEGTPAVNFQLNDTGVQALEYCRETGLLVGPSCTSKGVGYYNINKTLPSTCTGHGAVSEPESGTEEGGIPAEPEPDPEDLNNNE